MSKSTTSTKFKTVDGLVLISPLGEFPHGTGDKTVMQEVTNLSVEFMAETFKRNGNRPILIDFDHRSFEREDDTQAAGWIEDLIPQEDGLYARVRWSNAGQKALDGGEYRYLSPVWVTRSGGSRERRIPCELVSVGLTNRPNLPLPALSNSQLPDSLTDAARLEGTTQTDTAIENLIRDLFSRGWVRTGSEKALYSRLWAIKHGGSKEDLTTFNAFYLKDGVSVSRADLFGSSSVGNSTLTASEQAEGQAVSDYYLQGIVDNLKNRGMAKNIDRDKLYKLLLKIKHYGDEHDLSSFNREYLRGPGLKFNDLRPPALR